jgi:hypothetical protein
MIECVICKHRKVKSGLVSVSLERDDYLIFLTRFPTNMCENYGEYYFSESVTECLLNRL